MLEGVFFLDQNKSNSLVLTPPWIYNTPFEKFWGFLLIKLFFCSEFNPITTIFLYLENFISFIIWAKYDLSWLFPKVLLFVIDQFNIGISSSETLHTAGNSQFLEYKDIFRTF